MLSIRALFNLVFDMGSFVQEIYKFCDSHRRRQIVGAVYYTLRIWPNMPVEEM
jgi:hypothetical protein